jgi:hypothetical protein
MVTVLVASSTMRFLEIPVIGMRTDSIADVERGYGRHVVLGEREVEYISILGDSVFGD